MDITERKRLETAKFFLASIVESSADAIITVNLDGIITSWNKAAEQLYGYAAAEAIDKPLTLLTLPGDLAEILANAEKIKQSQTVETYETVHVHKDGRHLELEIVLSPVKDASGKVIGVSTIARDISERKRGEAELQESHERLEGRVRERTAALTEINENLKIEISERLKIEAERQKLLHRIVSTQEIERRRIARDLHDQLGQHLTALKLSFESVREQVQSGNSSGKLFESVEAQIKQIDTELDFLIWELRPAALNEVGLVAAVENFVQEWTKHCGIAADFHTAGLTNFQFASEVEVNLYRIAQEALNNVYKHAGATRVDVLLEGHGESITLIIEDDGQGFNLDEVSSGMGLGLLSMRERALVINGSLEIESADGQGTSIFVRVPLAMNHKE